MLIINRTGGGRYEWQFIGKLCVVHGTLTYGTKAAAKRAANRITEKIR